MRRLNLLVVLLNWWREAAAQWAKYLRLADPQTLEEELKTMHARGELERDEYIQARQKIQRGCLGRGDMDLLQARSTRKTTRRHGIEAVLEQDINRLAAYRVGAEDLQEELAGELAHVEQDLAAIRTLAEESGEKAARNLADEAAARRALECKHRLLERVESLSQRMDALHLEIDRLAAVQGDLLTYEAELKLLSAKNALVKAHSGAERALID